MDNQRCITSIKVVAALPHRFACGLSGSLLSVNIWTTRAQVSQLIGLHVTDQDLCYQ